MFLDSSNELKLNPRLTVPEPDACERLIAVVRGAAGQKVPVTFHRAFDVAKSECASSVVSAGFDRLLTSGQEKTAADGAALIAELIRDFGDRVVVVPGGGINEENLAGLLEFTGAREFHASARVTEASKMEFRNDRCSMGADSKDYDIQVTSGKRVNKMLEIFDRVLASRRDS